MQSTIKLIQITDEFSKSIIIKSIDSSWTLQIFSLRRF